MDGMRSGNAFHPGSGGIPAVPEQKGGVPDVRGDLGHDAQYLEKGLTSQGGLIKDLEVGGDAQVISDGRGSATETTEDSFVHAKVLALDLEFLLRPQHLADPVHEIAAIGEPL